MCCGSQGRERCAPNGFLETVTLEMGPEAWIGCGRRERGFKRGIRGRRNHTAKPQRQGRAGREESRQ